MILLSRKPRTEALSAAVFGFPIQGEASSGVASTIAADSATSQSAAPGATVSLPPTVLVTDAGGNPVAGVSVTFAVTGGGGSATGTSQTTAGDGTATVTSWTLGAVAGLNTMTATSGTLTGSPVTFNATGTTATGYVFPSRPVWRFTHGGN